jgi:hypothetical protein
VQFLYGGSSSVVAQQVTIFDNSEEGTMKYLLGGETSNAVDETEDIARFLFGGEALVVNNVAAVEQVIFNPEPEDPVAATTKYLYGVDQSVAPNPYEVDGKCLSEDCISFVLEQMQEELGITDRDLDEGLAWGEDMVQYCMFQARQASSPSKRAAPPLPQSYSKPPTPALCKNVIASSRMLVHTASL